METLIVIPARWGSTRFPGKPLAQVAGRSLLERVWRIARAAAPDVAVATDDPRIAEHVHGFGGRVAMTSEACQSGSERVAAALAVLGAAPEIVLNLQGDAVLTPPWVLQLLLDCLRENPRVEMATPAVRFTWEHYERFLTERASGKVGGTTVTFDRNHDALYFSKSPIPSVRERGTGPCPVFRHVGLYAWRRPALMRFLALPPGPLEATEKLEQLRALENGMPVRVVEVDYRGRSHWSIDNPEDVGVVEEIIRGEGELVA